MHRFFAEACGEHIAVLLPDEARHALTVLRLSVGDSVQAVVSGVLYDAVIHSVENSVTVELLSALPSPDPETRVTLYQGLPKGEKVDFLVQKCTEAGIDRIVPVRMPRCVMKLDDKDAKKRVERWQRIAFEAAKQSGRARVPEVAMPVNEKDLPALLKAHELVLVPWEDARGLSIKAVMREHPAARDIAIVIGPEGGMGQDEVDSFLSVGALPVTLGKRIFRTETAGLAALIMLLSENDEYA